MPFVSRVLVCARAYHTNFLWGLCAGFMEGGVVCVPTSLLEELCVVVFLSVLNMFLRQFAFVNHGVDELIVH